MIHHWSKRYVGCRVFTLFHNCLSEFFAPPLRGKNSNKKDIAASIFIDPWFYWLKWTSGNHHLNWSHVLPTHPTQKHLQFLSEGSWNCLQFRVFWRQQVGTACWLMRVFVQRSYAGNPTLPKLTQPLKIGHFKRKLHLNQRSIFRG